MVEVGSRVTKVKNIHTDIIYKDKKDMIHQENTVKSMQILEDTLPSQDPFNRSCIVLHPLFLDRICSIGKAN